MTSRPERIYRRLLLLLPAAFRLEAERELVTTFRLAHARAMTRGRAAAWLFWLRTIADVLVTAVAERFGRHTPRDPRDPRTPLLRGLAQDVRFACRMLARSPGFTVAAVITFALGIGVNVAVLAVVDRMLFRPLPYGDADRLVQVHNWTGPQDDPVEPTTYLPQTLAGMLRTQAQSIEDVAIARAQGDPVVLLDAASFQFDTVSYNLLQVLRVRPIAGRDFVLEDARSPENEILLADEAWARVFGRSTAIFDRTFQRDVGRATYRIVGILPAGFLVPTSSFNGRSDGIIVDRTVLDGTPSPMNGGRPAIARLRPGYDLAQAQAEVDVLSAAILKHEGREWRAARNSLTRYPAVVLPLRTGLFLLYRSHVWLVVAAVAAVFLLACVNLATLFLARGRAREQDAAIRAALGASRARVTRAAIVDSLVICGVSSALAVLACWAVFDVVMTLLPPAWRGLSVSPLDLRIVALTLGLAGLAAAVAGAAPAWRASRVDLVSALRRETRSTAARLRGGSTLLAIEAAFGVLLVFGAATTVRSFLQMIWTDPGYDVANLFDVRSTHGRARSGSQALTVRERTRVVLEEIRRTPGVVAVGAAGSLPVGRIVGTSDPFWTARGVPGSRFSVGEGFFGTLGTRLLAGRDIMASDLDSSAAVALVNRSGVAALWPGASPQEVIGRNLDLPEGAHALVGVVEDLRPLPGRPASPAVYLPLADTAAAAETLSETYVRAAVRVASGTTLDVASLDARLDARLSPDLLAASPVAETFPPHLQRPKFQAALFGTVAVIALVLAAVGLYSVAAFDVARRRFELGVRLSLGANAADVRRLVFRSALRPMVIGSAVGLLASWWSARFLQAFVVDVDVRDPWTLAGVAAVLIVTTVAAVWLPVRRASRIDPTAVLRAS